MLRRLASLWCLSAMLAGEVAQAKVLLVRQAIDINKLYGITLMQADEQHARNLRLVSGIIRRTGGSVRMISSMNLKTEWLRTGRVGYGYNTTSGLSSSSEQFDAVVSLWGGAVNGITSISTTGAGSARADSLTIWAVQNRSGAAVPALFLPDNSPQISGAGAQWAGTIRCSTGVVTNDAGAYGKLNFRPGSARSFWNHAYVEGATPSYSTGDLRKILVSRVFPYGPIYRGALACKWCDSLSTTTDSDTLMLWERQYGANPNKVATSGAKTIVFASAWGAGAANDSAAFLPTTEGDMGMILAGLARLDSIVRATSTTGGRVLGDKVIKIAPVIYGGLAQGQRHSWQSPGGAQGRSPSDTASFYAILDSLNALGIPVTFAVNVDSADSYARDLIKLKGVGMARFAPSVWNGCTADTGRSGGQDALYRPVDVFGKNRPRIAVGDNSGLGADSSLMTLAKLQLRLADSLFGRPRVSRIAVAPDDDWSPENFGIPASGMANLTVDSILYALQSAGYSGIVADGQDPDARATKRKSGPSRDNPRGALYEQGKYNSGSISALRGFKVLTHSGYAIMGGRSQWAAYDGSAVADSSNSPVAYTGLWYIELSRLWSGALADVDFAYDTWPDDNNSTYGLYDNIFQRKVDRTNAYTGRNNGGPWPAVKANVYRLSCADLSGAGYGSSSNAPAATGYWVLKAAKNTMDEINRLAGRTVVMFAYPDDIEP